MVVIRPQSILKGAVINGLSRIAHGLSSFLLLMLITKIYGAGIETDAYTIALGIPILFLLLGENVITISFLPTFIDYRQNQGVDKARDFSNSFFTILITVLSVISLLVFLFAPQLVSLIAPGFNNASHQLATLIVRIMSPVVVLAGFTGILTSFFHAEDNFTIPVVCSLFLVFGSIFSLLTLGKSIGIISVPIGFVTGLVVQVAVESRILKKHGWHLQIKGGWGDPGVKKVVLLAGPRFVGMAANRFIVMTDVFFATTLGTGAASVLHYADRLINFPVMIFLAAGGRTILPTLSKHASKNELEEINRIVANWMRMLTFILIPLMVLTYILHAHLIRLAFQRGAFDMHDFQMTASAYLYYNLGMISYCFNILLQITFFCLQDTATPMKIAVSAIFLNAGVDFFLIKIMGVGGIALATALVGMLRTGLLLNFLQKKIGDLGLKTILSGGLKHAIAAGIMGIFLWRFMQWLQTTMAGYNFSQTFHSIIFLTTGALLGGTLYFVASQLLKVEEFQKVSRFCMRRFAR